MLLMHRSSSSSSIAVAEASRRLFRLRGVRSPLARGLMTAKADTAHGTNARSVGPYQDVVYSVPTRPTPRPLPPTDRAGIMAQCHLTAVMTIDEFVNNVGTGSVEGRSVSASTCNTRLLRWEFCPRQIRSL